MTDPQHMLGRFLIAAGALLVVAGPVFFFAPKLPFLGELPGDIHIRREHVDMYVPLATSVVLSLLLSLAIWLFHYFTKK